MSLCALVQYSSDCIIRVTANIVLEECLERGTRRSTAVRSRSETPVAYGPYKMPLAITCMFFSGRNTSSPEYYGRI